MKKIIVQRVLFIFFAVCAFLNPIADFWPWFRFTMLAGSLLYLFMAWYFPMISDDKNLLENELAGFIYATVFMASFMEVAKMPLGKPLVYFGYLASLGLMIYMIVKRKSVRRDMLIQSVCLWLVSGVPLWI